MYELSNARALKANVQRNIVVRWIDAEGKERITETRGSVSPNLKRAIAKVGGRIVAVE